MSILIDLDEANLGNYRRITWFIPCLFASFNSMLMKELKEVKEDEKEKKMKKVTGWEKEHIFIKILKSTKESQIPLAFHRISKNPK